MNIKHVLLAILVCGIATNQLNAQSSRERPRAKAAMWNALQLTESQQTRVKNIHEKFAPQVQAVKKQASEASTRINDRELVEVRNILTSDQQQTFDSYMSGKKRVRRGSVARVAPVRIDISH
jgi:hypothetical protein